MFLQAMVVAAALVLIAGAGCGDDTDGVGAGNTNNSSTGTNNNSSTGTNNGSTGTTNNASTGTNNSSSTGTNNGSTGGCFEDAGCDAGFICELGACIEGCRVDPDCGLGQICEENTCIEGCHTDDQCNLGLVCRDLECVEICEDDSACEAGEICVDEDCVPGCRDDDQCAADEICTDETCVIGCRQDDQCDAGQICNDLNRCEDGCREDDQCEGELICLDGQCAEGCRGDNSCRVGFICEASRCTEGCREDIGCGADEICLDAICTPGCRENSDCADDEVCRDLQCVQGCDFDTNCGLGSICEDGQCTPGCRGDDDSTCPGDQICVSGSCIDGCRSDAACGPGTICEANLCVPGCRNDDSCGDGLICENDQCVVGCREDRNCGLERICVNDTCEDGCRDDNQCDSGRICENGACEDGCRQDVTCGLGFICEDNQCTDGCRNDAQCPADQICENDLCIFGCRGDGDCDAGQICEGNSCTEGCRSDLDCPNDLVCSFLTLQCVEPAAECGDDRFEPNNSFGAPTALEPGIYTGLSLCSSDRDVFSVQLSADDALFVSAAFDPSEGSLLLELYDPFDALIANGEANDSGLSLNTLITTDGTYTVRVRGASPAQEVRTYDLTISAESTVEPCAEDDLEANDSLDAAVSVPEGVYNLRACSGNEDWFAVDLGIGETVDARIDFSNLAGDLTLDLFAPDGRPLATSSSVRNFERITAIAEDDGTHYLRVTSARADGGSDYVLTLNTADLCTDRFDPNDTLGDRADIDTGTFTDLRICDTDDDNYLIDLGPDERLTVTITFDNGAGNLDLYLINSAGNGELARSVTNQSREEVVYDSDSNEPVFIRVRAASAPEPVGYSMTITVENTGGGVCDDQYEVNDSPVQAITPPGNSAVNANVCPGDSDWFAIPVDQAGTEIRLFGTYSTNQGVVNLAIIDRDGNSVLVEDNSRIDPKIISVNAPFAGTYYARATHGSGDTTTYTLSWTLFAPPDCDDQYEPNDSNNTATPLSETIPETVLCANDDDVFRIRTSTTYALTRVDMRFVNPVTGTAELTNADGDVLASTNLTADTFAFVETVTTEQGNYFLRISQTDGVTTRYSVEPIITNLPGSCEDRFEENDTADTAAEITTGTYPGLGICPVIDDNDYYLFTLDTPERVIFRIAFSQLFGDLDLEVYDAADMQLLGFSLSETNDEEIGIFLEPGDYLVRVFNFNASANDYTLSINLDN